MRKPLAAFVAMLVMATGFGFLAQPATAAESCDQMVVDDARVFGDQQSQVVQAAQQLTNLGADVRVRTIPSLGGFATLDALFKNTQVNCPSWTGTGTNRKSNLLVFMMTLNDRKVGIFYGDRWVDAFNKTGGDQRVWQDFMVPAFRDGNYAKGFVDGMNESHRVLDLYIHPPANTGTGTVVNKQPTDYSGLWKVLGIGLVLVFVVVVGVLVFLAIRRRREAEEDRKTMRQRALTARDAASDILQNIGSSDRKAVRSAKVSKYSQVGNEQAEVLSQAMSDVDSNYESATNGMAAAASASANADDGNLTTGEYEQMAVRYEDALEMARDAKKADDLINSTCADIDSKLQKVSQDILTVQSGLDQLKAALESLKNEGIKCDGIDDHVTAATAALSEAQANSTDLSALKHLEEAQSNLQAGQDAVSAIADHRQKLAEGLPALEKRADGVKQTLSTARDAFERISKTYAPSSWEAVKGNGTEAEKRIGSAEKCHADATEQSDMQHQAWDDALASLQEGNLLLDKAQGLLRSITELEGNLQAAKQQAPQEIDAAQADIDKAASYLHQYDADIKDSIERDLDKARKQLDQARQELAKDLPDYLVVMKLATDANSAADTVYAECVEEHEAAERLRRQAASTLSQAEATVSKAEEYIDDHQSDVGSSAEDDLSSAKQSLQQARNQRDPAKVLKSASNAVSQAESAYDRARSDFDDAEDERRRERERNNTIIVGSYSSSHTDYDSGSSWGSSSGGFGGFGDGGGSSGSFGGGGDGGGSSGGW